MLTAKTVRVWYKTHKWTSLICTAFLLMACLTGLPLIFEEELEPVFDHQVKPADLPPDAPVASLDAMVAAARQKIPNLQPYSLSWDDDEPRVSVLMSPSPKPEVKLFRTVIFDQHTGRLLETGQLGSGVMAWILQLHARLFMELPGELLMGVVALLFVIALVSGALVYGPFMRRLDFGTYRKSAAARTRWLDLHNLLGIVTLAWALVVGATGVMNALSTPLFGLWRAQVIPPLLAPYRGKPMPTHLGSLDKAVALTSSALPGTEITSVLFPNGVVASPRHYVVWTKGKTPITSRLFTPVMVDAETGQLTLAQGLPWYLRALELSRPLHFGDYGGLPLKIFWAVLDVFTIVVLGSGLYLWLSHRKRPIEQQLDELMALESAKQEQTI